MVGIFNIKKREETGFLVATFALIGVSAMTVWKGNPVLILFDVLVENLGTILVRFVDNIILLVVPAAVVIGIKAVWLFAIEK